MQRPSNELAAGTNDDTIPFVDPLSSFSVVLRLELEPIWEVFLAQGDRAADHVHPPLLGDVPQGGEPGLAPVPGGSEVNLYTPGIQSITRQRHVILPADQTAKLTEGGVEDPERAAVTLCPHHALWGGWHQLLVLAQQVTFGIDIEQGIVQAGVAGLRVALVQAHYHVNAGLPSGPTELLGSQAGDCHRLIEQLPVQVGKHLVLSGRNTPHPVRIGGDEGLREDHQANVVILCCLGDQLASLVDGSFALHKYWRALHGGDLEGRHGPSLSFIRCRYFRDQSASSDYHSCGKPTALLLSPLVYIKIDQ